MGYWQGVSLGNAVARGRAEGALGDAIGRLQASRNNVAAFKKANDELVALANEYGYEAGLFGKFRNTIIGKGRDDGSHVPVPGGLHFVIFAETRPDLLPDDATINERRAKNIEIIAWAEYLMLASFSGQNLAQQDASKIGRLSELVEGGVFDNAKVASSLRDLAEKAKAVAAHPYYDTKAKKWVEDRISELRNVAKFRKGETIPVFHSVNPSDPVLQAMVSHKDSNKKFNVVEDNALGISDLTR